MRGYALLLVLFAGIVLPALAPAPGQAQQSGTTVIRGGWLFDAVGDDLRRNPGILVRAGKIMRLGVDGDVPPGARVVELGEDEYILPGLIDLHAHYNMNLFGRRRRDEVVVNPVVFLANGVTSTFPAGEYNPEAMFALSDRIARGEQPGPRLFNSGPYFGSVRPGWHDDISPEEIRAEVDRWAARGAKGFKAKGIRPEHLRVLIEQAHRHGLTVTGHLGSGSEGSVNPREAIRMGIDRVEHFMGGDAMPPTRSAYESLVDLDLDSPEVREIMQTFITHGIYYDATLTAYGYTRSPGDLYDYWMDERKFLTPFMRKHLEEHPPRRYSEQFERIHEVKLREVKVFFDAGGEHLITLGTDHPSWGEWLSGFAAHRELEALTRAGIPPAAVLKIGTINGARALNVSDRLGSIEAGKWADLFVVRGNPLRDIRNTRNVQMVVKAGEVFDPQALLRSVEGRLGPRDATEAEGW